MLFNYKTISVSKEVEMNIETIRANQACIIRTANIRPDGSLIHNETIDENLIQLVGETVAEQKLLIGEVIANNFYYDEDRSRYLSLDTIIVDFYINGTSKKNAYMYNIPSISSNTVPFRVVSEHVIVGVEGYTSTSIPNGTGLFTIKSIANASNLYTWTNTSGTSVTEFYNDTLNVLVPAHTKLASYVNNFAVDNPVFRVHLKRTYYPI